MYDFKGHVTIWLERLDWVGDARLGLARLRQSKLDEVSAFIKGGGTTLVNIDRRRASLNIL